MPDEKLLNELQEKAMALGLDARFLINELIKRYKIRCFEVAALKEKLERKAIPQSPAATAPFTQGSLGR